MDKLLLDAKNIARQPIVPYLPIKGRIAYVVSHGQSYASNGYAIRTQGIAKALNQQGIEVLCFVRPGRPWELGQSSKIAPDMVVDGVRYIHSRWKQPQDERMHLEVSVQRFVELFTIYRPAIVLAASNWIVGLPAWIAAKRLGLPFYNEVRGFWELSRNARDPSYAKTIAFQQEAERDTFVAKQSVKVFTLNQQMKGELVKRGIVEKNIILAPNGTSELPGLESASPALKKKLNIHQDEKVIGYVGSFNTYEGLDILLEACSVLVEKGEKIKLILVGDDQALTAITPSNTKIVNQPWLIQVGRVPHEKVASYYALIDVIVVPRKKLPVCELVSPMKVVEALAYSKRLVVSDLLPLTEYKKIYTDVVVFDPNHSGSLEHAIQKALKLPAPKAMADILFSNSSLAMLRALKELDRDSVLPLINNQPESLLIKNAPDVLKLIESEIIDYAYGDTVYAVNLNSDTKTHQLSKNRAVEWIVNCQNYEEVDFILKLKSNDLAARVAFSKEVIAQIEFYDDSDNKLEAPKDIPKSHTVGSYAYLKYMSNSFTRLSLPVPNNASKLHIKILKWGNKGGAVSSRAYYSAYKPGVSVILPSYKGRSTVLECLESLGNQTLSKSSYEIILILNGKPDGSEEIIEKFKNKNSEINLIVIKSDTVGAGAARNIGIKLSKFKYTTFIDDDDLVSPRFLESLINQANENKVVLSNIEDFNESGNFESIINKQILNNVGSDISDYSKISLAVTMNACKIVPTKLAKSVMYDETLKSGEDVDYWSRLVCSFTPVFRCVEPESDAVYYRRVRENSVSRQTESFEFNIRQRLEVIKKIEAIKANEKLTNFLNSKVNGQLGFINKYLNNNSEQWGKFKELAEELNISSRVFQLVNERQARTLVVSYCFPPYIDTAGIVCAKRIIENNKPVDVISNTMEGVRQKDDKLWGLISAYVGNFKEVQTPPSFSNWKVIERFCSEVLLTFEKNKNKYKEIYSRSMWPGSHFAAALIKIKYPEIKWIAEFSDPLSMDVQSKERTVEMDQNWLFNNGFIDLFKNSLIDNIKIDSYLFHWCERLPYILANEIVFTNESQKKYMIEMLNDNALKSKVESKSLVKPHPTLPKKYYSLSDFSYNLDDRFINIGYFGAFYATRGLGDVLKAIESMDYNLRSKIRVHIFTPQPDAVKINQKISTNIILNYLLPYFDFLSISKKFDVLLVNDAETKGLKWINPYLPSKLSDYRGSGADIWALCESGSVLHQLVEKDNIHYFSFLEDKESSLKTLLNIISDKNK